MTVLLKKPSAACIPIHLTDRAGFAAHTCALPAATRQWLATVGLDGAPDSHVLLPDAGGRLQSVWAGVRGEARAVGQVDGDAGSGGFLEQDGHGGRVWGLGDGGVWRGREERILCGAAGRQA